ncbi:MAG TPA: hypothetical protein VK762_01870 [Polyangiaceae bacterium]|jgi:hypothetical protein|nr:hypothetical protein [Polyangiaceae bacterium]
MKEAAKIVVGSCLVYVAMAACSASDGGFVPVDGNEGDATAIGDDAQGGGRMSSDKDSGSMMSTIMDALTDPVPAAKADPVSGSRLKTQYWNGADGSKQAMSGFYDSMLGETCYPSTASDGQMRCMPGMAGVSSFGDSGCTQSLALVVGCGTTPKYASQSVAATACNRPQTTYYALGSPFNGSMYYSGTPASCTGTPVSALTAEGYSLYTLGAQVPASTFVAITVTTDP